MSDVLAIGKVIKMPCMRSGVCKYTNENILVTKAALDQMKQSAIGIPVIIEHPTEKITDESIKTMPVVGRVADLHYIEAEELWYAHFVVDTSEAVSLLENGHGVSTAWYGEKYGESGTFNNSPFDRELIEGRYEHLAIVATPRYEMAINPIFMNSKDGQVGPSEDKLLIEIKKGSVSMLGKIFKKFTSREEIMVNSNEQYVVDVDGKEVDLKDAIEAMAEPKLNGETLVDIDGEKISLNSLIECFKNAKKNEFEKKEKEDDEEDDKGEKKQAKKNEDDEKEETEDEKKVAKKNMEDKEAKDKEDAAKKNEADELALTNARHKELEDAHINSAMLENSSEQLSLHDRVKLGVSRYGSKK
jgi:hypothetical protein